MSILSVNLSTKMLSANHRALASQTAILSHQISLDAQIERLRVGAEKAFADGKATEVLDAAKVLGFDYKVTEASAIKAQNAAISHLPQDRIFTTAAIKDVCLTYGLRFLPSSLYKGALDDQIPAKLEEFKRLNGGMPGEKRSIRIGQWGRTVESSFYIAAPTASFALSPRPKDPLLFAYLGSDRWFLIHKWGDDLNVGARIANWDWTVLGTILITICGVMTAGALAHLICPQPGWQAGSMFGLFAIIPCLIWNDYHPSNRVTEDNWNSPFSN